MIIERFFRVIADSKALLALGSDGEFVLTLSLFKMMEALEIKDIDMMIRSLEKELQGVEVTEIMVTTPDQDNQEPNEIITITEDEIIATLPKTVSSSPKENTAETKSIPQEEKLPKKEEIDTAQKENTEVKQEQPVTQAVSVDKHKKIFDDLIAKIYDRDFELGECFKQNIEFESFQDGKLSWGSSAQGDDKKQLITHWGIINMFVKELFGLDTKIINNPKKKASTSSNDEVETSSETDKLVAEPVEAPHSDANSSSMIEDVEMKSSCISPEAGDTEAAKEKDPSTLLDEPMIKEAIALFDPKKVRIKRNS